MLFECGPVAVGGSSTASLSLKAPDALLSQEPLVGRQVGTGISHPPPPRRLCRLNPVITFGSGERGLGRFASVAAVVLVEGQAVLPGSCHHLGVGLQLLGPGQGFGPVDPPRVCVGHVQLPTHWVGGQVVAMRWVVAAFKKTTGL